MTACDVAHANNHIELANRLECEMVFESPPDEVSGWLEELSTPSTFVSPNVQTSVVAAQVLSWLDGQLDDAARVMSLPIEHAEACLEVNDWNLPATVQAFTSNAEELLRKAKLRREDADDVRCLVVVLANSRLQLFACLTRLVLELRSAFCRPLRAAAQRAQFAPTRFEQYPLQTSQHAKTRQTKATNQSASLAFKCAAGTRSASNA